jgi:hypothetical protein
MQRLMVLIAAGALLGLSAAAMAQSGTGGMSGGRGGASIGPAPGTPGDFTRPRGSGTTGTESGVTGRMPDANRSDNDQNPGRRRPPVQPPDSGNANGGGGLGADSSTPAPIIAPPSPFGAR